MTYFTAPGITYNQSRHYSTDEIISAVCEATGITEPVLFSRNRIRTVADARQICMYFMNKLTAMSLHDIGTVFNRDHSTVIHARRKVSGLIDVNDPIVGVITKVEQLIDR